MTIKEATKTLMGRMGKTDAQMNHTIRLMTLRAPDLMNETIPPGLEETFIQGIKNVADYLETLPPKMRSTINEMVNPIRHN